MLKIDRQNRILEIVKETETASVKELSDRVGASEATVRRDLTELEEQGQLIKVHGGAMFPDFTQVDRHPDFREVTHKEEKRKIAAKAVRLIEPNDLVYLDAGTTTGTLTATELPREAVYVTNDIAIAERLMMRGLTVHVLGGRLKEATRALVGETCVAQLASYNFNIGFFGTNAYDEEAGFSTPDIGEATCKRTAISRCARAYALADTSKAGKRSKVVFADFTDLELITED